MLARGQSVFPGLSELARTLVSLRPVSTRSRPVTKSVPQPREPSILTPTEESVLAELSTHLSIPAISDRLGVAPSTVRSHVRSIYRKMGVHTRADAVGAARRTGLMKGVDA